MSDLTTTARQRTGTSSSWSAQLLLMPLLPLLLQLFTCSTTSADVTPNSSGARRAFFNASTVSVATLRGALNLTGHTLFSFRTCSSGVLISQTGSSGDQLTIRVTPGGGLTMSWVTRDGVSDSVSLTGGSNGSGTGNQGGTSSSPSATTAGATTVGFSNNQWYTVDLKYLLGKINLRVEAGSRLLDSVLVSNSTYRRYLWDLDLSGGTGGLTVGEGFTGCIEQGAGIQFDTPGTTGENVRWGQCPLEAPTVRGCDLQQYNPCYSYPCLNDGTCVANGSLYTCKCPVPFIGERCELDLGDQVCTLSEPCQNGGTCSILTGQTRRFICNCPSGFTGKLCENNIDECGSVPCLNGGMCQDRIDGFICDCAGTGYNGTFCETNLDECESGQPCINGGTCINTPGSYKCACLNGYDGKNCEIDLDECVSEPCQNGGVCTDYLGMYKCDCRPGFTGANCEINIDDCVQHTCLDPRRCVDGINNHTCECKPGYTESSNKQCVDTNECMSNPCRNGAACINSENKFVCNCLPGYTGLMCEQNIDECASRPCQNGASCFDEVDRFRCECVAGFTGPMCEEDINECASNPCLNGAECRNLIGMYECGCLAGFTGSRCEVNINECADQPCLNQAQCIDEVNAYSCVCPNGFDGRLCENNIDDCLSTPCQNSATCVDGVAKYTCNCTSSWMGTNCDQPYDACAYTPCANGGTCTSILGTPTYTCQCWPGFTGSDCETNIDDCVDHKCPLYKVCVDLITAYDCRCPTGYTGAQCEVDIDECVGAPCLNGATCRDEIGNYTCQCPGEWIDLRNFTGNANHRLWSGYSGRHCELLVDECQYKKEGTPVCLNDGICKKEANTTDFKCFCGNNQGNFYLGKHCEKTRQHCELVEDPPACHNGGTCFNLEDDYMCSCVPGYSDVTERNRCRVNIDECASNPCQNNASCVDGVNSYQCVCPPGLSGNHCEVNIDECQSTPCLNGGRCMDAINKYVCDCGDTGFEGVNCELNIDDCDPTPCQNGATCMDGIKNYTCSCNLGYTGVDCDIDVDECLSQPCQNGATCRQLSDPTRPGFSYNMAAGYQCQCAPGYNGTHCELDIDECSVGPCRNGACQDRINSYYCLCDPGYEGKNCDIDIDECAVLKPCKNGAQCIDQVASYQCVCAAETNGTSYGGVNCTVPLVGCAGNMCQNDARCVPILVSESENNHNYTCHCQAGYTGFFCDVGTTVTFNGTSWMKHDVNMQLTQLAVDLSFRTTLPNGTLFHMSDTSGTKRVFLVLAGPQLLTLYVKFAETQTISLSGYSIRDLNNAEWHRVTVYASDGDIILSLSSNDCARSSCVSRQSLGNMREDPMFSTILFGGLQMADQEPTLTSQASALTGCLQDIKVNDRFVLPSAYVADPQMSSGVTLGCPRSDQCMPQPCQNTGVCVDLWDRFSCQCVRPFIGNTCNISVVPVTFGYRNSPSHVQFDIPIEEQTDLASINLISMFFRTRQDTGLLAFLGPIYRAGLQPRTFLRADMQDGYVVVSSKLSPNQNTHITMDARRYDDGEQHFLYINRTRDHLRVTIGEDFKEVPVTIGLGLSAEVLYLGALPTANVSGRRKRAVSTMSNPDAFKGTLQDVRLNGQLAEFYPVNTPGTLPSLQPATLSNVQQGEVDDDLCAAAVLCEQNATCESVFFNDYKCHCPEGFKGKNCSDLNFCIYNECPASSTCNDLADGHECTIPATFNGQSTMVKYVTSFATQASRQNVVQLALRTRQTEGLVLHLRGAGSLDTYYLTLQLYRSSLVLRYDLGEYRVMATTTSPLTDGQWHNVTVNVREDRVELTVDTESKLEATTQYKTLSELINGTYDIYLGGVPQGYYLANSDQFQVEPTFFKGCMDEVRIDRVLLPYFTLDQGYNSSAGEQFSVVSKTSLEYGCNGDPVCNTHVCGNGASCVDIWNSYSCSCVLGYNGTFCGNNIDDCVNHECLNGAQCVDQVANYSCACAPGYTDNRCQTEIDECLSDPCQNNATCVDRVDGYFCNCSANFTGGNCEISVTEKCDNETNYPCKFGICNTIDTAYEGVVTFSCGCYPGYTGHLCEAEIDYCAVNPCINGTCRSNINITDYECLCQPGFTGKNCSEEIDECASSPCSNGGTCNDLLNGYNCTCPEEWMGVHCEMDVDECNMTARLCENGECVNKDGGYDCDCTGTGYKGDRCEIEIDECELIPPVCQNNGDCINKNGSYDCNCTVGYQGKNCSTPNCTDVCFNKGVCSITADNKWKCSCPQFVEGDQCESRGPCVDEPCGNGGTCKQELTNGTWNYTCLCTTGWMGQNCTEDVKECERVPSPCQNGGTCTELDGSYNCTCAMGYTGTDCETEINECLSNPCVHGWCDNRVGAYYCNCTDTGYEGQNCADNVNECTSNIHKCLNGTCVDLNPDDDDAEYRCDCYPGYMGPFCGHQDPCAHDIPPCLNGGNCTSVYNTTANAPHLECFCTNEFTGPRCATKIGAIGDGDNVPINLIIGLSVFALLLLIFIAVISFMLVAKNKRATRGTYSPSRQEMSGSRVEMGNVLKPPPEERLI